MSDETWAELKRPTPDWFAEAKFGIFIHWGAYAVPAWAEPIGELGTIEPEEWFFHNPYSEWYFNTLRLEGSAAQAHHRADFGDAPYDDFLDSWRAADFDPADWARLFRHAGADYVIPTTKHHDGITLWDAPGTGDRNTVRRGPRQDLVQRIADAVRAEGMRFGVYYSGGLDWSVTPHLPPITGMNFEEARPKDAAYNYYALEHVRDLVERYRPDILWNDINWPDAGKRSGSDGLVELFESYYAAHPEGVVNDRWGVPHWDFRTSEYAARGDAEADPMWENCRGIGFSFGFNSIEGSEHTLTPLALAQYRVDVVARGGRLLLNVGPTADGRIPDLQRATLERFGDWKGVVQASSARTVPPTGSLPQTDEPWIRHWETPDETLLFVATPGNHRIPLEGTTVVRSLVPGHRAEVRDGGLQVSVGDVTPGPAVFSWSR